MTWVAVGVAAVGMVSSIAGGISGKKAAEKAGEMQAMVIEQTAAENERRRKLDLAQQLGGITAAVSASNLQMSGSSKRYKAAYESNYRAEMAWDKQKSRIDARTAIKGGGAAGQSAMYSGIGSALNFAGSAIAAMPSKAPATPTVT